MNVVKTLVVRGVGDLVIDARDGGSAITLSADGIVVEGPMQTGSSASNAGINVTSASRDNLIKGNTVTEI